MNSKKKFIEYSGDLKDFDGEQDRNFWRTLTTEEKFAASWEIITDFYKSHGRKDELRFSRTTETAGET